MQSISTSSSVVHTSKIKHIQMHSNTKHKVDWMSSVHSDLLIGHPVDDAVISGIHVPEVVGDHDDG